MLTLSGLGTLLSHLADSRGNRRAGLPTPGGTKPPARCPGEQRSAEGAAPFPRVTAAGVPSSAPVPEVGESGKGQKRTKHFAFVKIPTRTLPPSERARRGGGLLSGQISSGLFGSARRVSCGRWRRARRCPHLSATCSLGVTWPYPSAPPICLRRAGVTPARVAQVCPFAPLLVHNGVPGTKQPAPHALRPLMAPEGPPPGRRPASASPPPAPHLAATPPPKKTQLSSFWAPCHRTSPRGTCSDSFPRRPAAGPRGELQAPTGALWTRPGPEVLGLREPGQTCASHTSTTARWQGMSPHVRLHDFRETSAVYS